MSLTQNTRCLHRAGLLALALGLCLQPWSTRADVPVTPAPAASAPAAKLPPARKARPSTLAAAANGEAAAPRNATRASKRRNAATARAPQQATAQAAELATRQRAAEKRTQRIGELLTRAQLDYLEGRVFEPANDNAAARYQEVLALDPGQPEALTRLQRITNILAAEGEHVALAGDAPRTLEYILLIRELRPNDSSLPGLDARYQALLANPVVFSARQQDRYVRSAQNIDEAYDKLKNQPLDLQTIEQVVRRYDRAKKLVTRAPGLPKLKDRIIITFPAAVRAELADGQPRNALNVVEIARAHGWFTAELEQLEAQAKQGVKEKWLIPAPPQQP